LCGLVKDVYGAFSIPSRLSKRGVRYGCRDPTASLGRTNSGAIVRWASSELALFGILSLDEELFEGCFGVCVVVQDEAEHRGQTLGKGRWPPNLPSLGV